MNASGKHVAFCLGGRESERYVDLTPMHLAESLCLGALRNHSESRARNTLVDAYASACYDLDHVLAIPYIVHDEHGGVERFNAQRKVQMLGNIVRLLGSAPRLDRASPDQLHIAMQMKRLAIFLPAFRTRMLEQQLDTRLIAQIHSGLCSHINILEGRMHDSGVNHHVKKQIAAHKAECEIMALLTRQGKPHLFPYPALNREEASHARKQYNHDFYTMRGNRKTPVQVKTSSNGSGYNGTVVVIQHYDILRAMKREPEKHVIKWQPARHHQDFEWPNSFVYEQILTGQAPDPLGELLTEELGAGKQLTKDKKRTLDLASSYVNSKLHAK